MNGDSTKAAPQQYQKFAAQKLSSFTISAVFDVTTFCISVCIKRSFVHLYLSSFITLTFSVYPNIRLHTKDIVA